MTQSVATNIQGDHRVVYSTVNTAPQRSSRRFTHSKTSTCSAGELVHITSNIVELSHIAKNEVLKSKVT